MAFDFPKMWAKGAAEAFKDSVDLSLLADIQEDIKEDRIKLGVRRLLKRYNVHYIMPVQNGMGTPALDFHCCVNGKYLAIETKRPGSVPTARQRNIISGIEKAGGYVMVVSDAARLIELEVVLIALSN